MGVLRMEPEDVNVPIAARKGCVCVSVYGQEEGLRRGKEENRRMAYRRSRYDREEDYCAKLFTVRSAYYEKRGSAARGTGAVFVVHAVISVHHTNHCGFECFQGKGNEIMTNKGAEADGEGADIVLLVYSRPIHDGRW